MDDIEKGLLFSLLDKRKLVKRINWVKPATICKLSSRLSRFEKSQENSIQDFFQTVLQHKRYKLLGCPVFPSAQGGHFLFCPIAIVHPCVYTLRICFVNESQMDFYIFKSFHKSRLLSWSLVLFTLYTQIKFNETIFIKDC